MKLVHRAEIEGQYPVTLYQRKNGTFKITYGAETFDRRMRWEAAAKFGECIFHALECAGRFDETNTREGE